MYQGWKSVAYRGGPRTTSHAPRATLGLVTAAFTVALVGGQFAAPAPASAATTPGAPVITPTAEPPAGTQSCPLPTGGGQSTLAMGTVCSFTLSPNPADTGVPTGTSSPTRSTRVTRNR